MENQNGPSSKSNKVFFHHLLDRQESTNSIGSIKSLADFFSQESHGQTSQQIMDHVLKYCAKKKPVTLQLQQEMTTLPQPPPVPQQQPVRQNLSSSKKREFEKFREFSQRLDKILMEKRKKNAQFKAPVSPGSLLYNSMSDNPTLKGGDEDMDEMNDSSYTLTPPNSSGNIKRCLVTEFEECAANEMKNKDTPPEDCCVEGSVKFTGEETEYIDIRTEKVNLNQTPVQPNSVMPMVIHIYCPMNPGDGQNQSAFVSATAPDGRSLPVLQAQSSKNHSKALARPDDNNNNNNTPRMTFQFSGSIQWHN